jgi:hypothetical protein
VNGHASLRRLLTLRRRAEARALDAVTMAEQACRRAEQDVEAAAVAITQQGAHARARELAMIDALLGRPVPSNVLATVQAGLDTLGRTAGELRERQASMRAGLAERTEALGRARDDYRLRQRATSKLDLTVQRQASEIARREAALAEALEEDLAGRLGQMGRP